MTAASQVFGVIFNDAPFKGDSKLVLHWKILLAALRDKCLSRSECAVLGEVLNRINNESGTAWPAMSTIAADAGVDRSTVVRAIPRLVAAGYLTKVRGCNNYSNRYRVGTLKQSSPKKKLRKSMPMSEGGCEAAPGVGADSHLLAGAVLYPELTQQNLKKEHTHEQHCHAGKAAGDLTSLTSFDMQEQAYAAYWKKRGLESA